MGFFDFLRSSKKEVTSETIKDLTIKWFSYYIENFRIAKYPLNEHELYMFCGWIIWDYMNQNGYLTNHFDETKKGFLDFLYAKVSKYIEIDFDDFKYRYNLRIKMYRNEMTRLRTSTKICFLESLYGALYKNKCFEIETYYDCIGNNELKEICEFMDFFQVFNNKVYGELLRKYKISK